MCSCREIFLGGGREIVETQKEMHALRFFTRAERVIVSSSTSHGSFLGRCRYPAGNFVQHGLVVLLVERFSCHANPPDFLLYRHAKISAVH